jgi:uncharacterized protein YbaR (Trm112 family)
MALDAYVLSVIVDPIDHGPLTYVEADSVLFNPRRRVVFPVRGAIPVLIPDEARDATDEEVARWS